MPTYPVVFHDRQFSPGGQLPDSSPREGDRLDCGHLCGPRDGISPGYALVDGETTVCYDCAHAKELEHLRTANHAFAYLEETKGPTVSPSLRFSLVSFRDKRLFHVVYAWKARNNFAGHIYRIQAIDFDGCAWYGTSPGPGMYARLHKCKRDR